MILKDVYGTLKSYKYLRSSFYSKPMSNPMYIKIKINLFFVLIISYRKCIEIISMWFLDATKIIKFNHIFTYITNTNYIINIINN